MLYLLFIVLYWSNIDLINKVIDRVFLHFYCKFLISKINDKGRIRGSMQSFSRLAVNVDPAKDVVLHFTLLNQMSGDFFSYVWGNSIYSK